MIGLPVLGGVARPGAAEFRRVAVSVGRRHRDALTVFEIGAKVDVDGK